MGSAKLQGLKCESRNGCAADSFMAPFSAALRSEASSFLRPPHGRVSFDPACPSAQDVETEATVCDSSNCGCSDLAFRGHWEVGYSHRNSGGLYRDYYKNLLWLFLAPQMRADWYPGPNTVP